jgi:putative tryptophan/tyrosine transport system substrate-binding protein
MTIRFLRLISGNSQSAIRIPKLLFFLGALLLALCFPAQAQQQAKVPRIGYLASLSTSSDPRIGAFRQRLRELGYREGQNILIEYRYAEGKLDRLPDLAEELVRLKVDVIVAAGATAIRAAKNVTQVIPIVMAQVSDPVALGLVASLAKPGANITGLTHLAPDLGGKRLELLKEIVPKLSRVAVLVDPSALGYGPQMKEIKIAAPALGLQLQPVEVQGPNDLEKAFSAMTRRHAGALIGLQLPTLDNLRERIVDFAAKSRLPAMYPGTEYTDAGGLMSYGPNISDLFRRAAAYVDKILKGAKPADLPVEQATKFDFVINLKTAKQIGVTIPQSMLYRADKVIR